MTIRILNAFLRLAHHGARHATAISVGLLGTSMCLHVLHLSHIQSLRSAAGRVQGAIVEMESSQRGYLLLGPQSPGADAAAPFLAKYDLYGRLLDDRMAELCRAIPANPANDRLCQALAALVASKRAEMDRTLSLAQHGGHGAALRLFASGTGREMENDIERTLDQVRLNETGGYRPARACLVP